MRIVTANVQHGRPDPPGRPALASAMPPLGALDADVYAFQELDHRRLRTRLAHQGQQVARALDGELVWTPAKRVLWGFQANALVVRGEVVEQEVVALAGAGERRVVLLATVVVRGERWTVGTTHLSLDSRSALRQVSVALDALVTRPGPWVLAGDLNLEPFDVAPVATDHGFDLVDGPPTVDARRTPTRRLDHVLTKACEVTASGVEKLPVSDHLAVWADLH